MRFSTYDPGEFYDELYEGTGQPRPESTLLLRKFASLPEGELKKRQQAAERVILNMGMTFGVYGSDDGHEQIFPFDIVPRIVTASEWEHIESGLAQRLHVPFADGDDFHPAENVAKMSAGIPLTDADRLPWLHALAAWLREHSATGGVLSCSALRRSYRDILREGASTVRFVHLDGSPEVVARRVAGRPGHFMPASLLTSQFETLEPLAPDERGVVVSVEGSVDEIVEGYLAATRLEED